MERKYLNKIIGKQYLDWKEGDIVLFNAGTGTGKTSFIKTELNMYCNSSSDKILFLSNRNKLKEQTITEVDNFVNDVKGFIDIDLSNITIRNYQELEAICRTDEYDLSRYKYVVMDEAHYFFTDSAFNNKTDLFFKQVMEDKSVIKIFMTATPIILKKYFTDKAINIDYEYELKTDYSYLDNVICYSNKDTVLSIIKDIPQDEQIIYFGSAKRALDIAQTFGGAFVCSQHNKDYYKKYVAGTKNEDELDLIIAEQRFKSHLLCTTIALDNGINLKENSNLKHVIIEVSDRDVFIQCLGRKRVANGEKVNLYFYDYSNNMEIGGYKSRLLKPLAEAETLKSKGEIEYVIAYNKQSKSGMVDFVVGKDGHTHAQLNECMYRKYLSDMDMYNKILNKEEKYKDIIASILGVEVIEKEGTEVKTATELYLDGLVGKPLYKDEQVELAEKLNIRKDGKLLKSIKSINAYFEEENLLYLIKSERKSYRDTDGKVKKHPTAWYIYSLNTNVD